MNKNEKFVITINRELGSGGPRCGRHYQLVIAADGKTEEQMADLIMQYIED